MTTPMVRSKPPLMNTIVAAIASIASGLSLISRSVMLLR